MSTDFKVTWWQKQIYKDILANLFMLFTSITKLFFPLQFLPEYFIGLWMCHNIARLSMLDHCLFFFFFWGFRFHINAIVLIKWLFINVLIIGWSLRILFLLHALNLFKVFKRVFLLIRKKFKNISKKLIFYKHNLYEIDSLWVEMILLSYALHLNWFPKYQMSCAL